MLSLVVRREHEVMRFPIVAHESRIGSGHDNEIVLPFPGISRTHAVLVRNGHDVFVTDSGSKNGLYLGGQRVERVPLVAGVSVRLGPVLISVGEEDTRDLIIASRLITSEPSPGCAPGPTETIEESSDIRTARILAFVRRYERVGRVLSSQQQLAFLAEARVLLEAEALAICAGPPASARILAISGAPIPNGRLESLLTQVPSGASIAEAVPARIGLDACLLGRLGADFSSPSAVAVFRRGFPRAGSWQTDLFSYVCDRVGAGGRREDSRVTADQVVGEVAASQGLKLPDGMVVGPSPAMAELLEEVRVALSSRLDVLVLGETGVGKELVARMIHASGSEAAGPIVSVNCAAIPPDLLEAELFGILPRTATGVEARPGLFLLADGGTIFLDEVGELAEILQAKLLRFLQEREVHPVGASAPRKLTVRVISASNRDLQAEAEQGRFRADLYYRLRGLQLHVPPVRDRREDIPALVLALAERAAREYGKTVRGVSEKALDLLTKHDWPGNVREMDAEVRRAVLRCPSGDFLRTEHFVPAERVVQSRPGSPDGERPVEPRPSIRSATGEFGRSLGTDGAGRESLKTLRERLEETERCAIEEALSRTRGNQTAAAKLLGITRNGLALKLARLRRALNR